MTNSSRGLVCVLTIWYFQPFGNAGLPRSCQAHSQYPPESNPRLLKLMTIERISSLLSLQTTEIIYKIIQNFK